MIKEEGPTPSHRTVHGINDSACNGGTFKNEDIPRNIEHITDIIRAGYWLGGIEMPGEEVASKWVICLAGEQIDEIQRTFRR